jgi:hypothetical protein
MGPRAVGEGESNDELIMVNSYFINTVNGATILTV